MCFIRPNHSDDVFEPSIRRQPPIINGDRRRRRVFELPIFYVVEKLSIGVDGLLFEVSGDAVGELGGGQLDECHEVHPLVLRFFQEGFDPPAALLKPPQRLAVQQHSAHHPRHRRHRLQPLFFRLVPVAVMRGRQERRHRAFRFSPTRGTVSIFPARKPQLCSLLRHGHQPGRRRQTGVQSPARIRRRRFPAKPDKSRRGEMSEGEVAFYAYQILVGLSDLHAMGIVHCDLKPHNVLVFPMQQNGINHLKIADFGLAIRDNNGKKVEEEVSKKYGCRGTLQYASPESLHGIHEAPRDVWALGCITVEMITGKSVWGQYCNRADLMAKIETLEPKIPENVSVFCKDFLNKCLNRNSEGRWSATRLMTHPFFLRNLAPVIYWTKVDCDYELPENPFGYDDQWVNNKDLFSTFNRYSHYDCMDDEEEYIC
nr:mitogen-activated protein kinase kinase kinase 18-like [Ipomoea batatas]